MRPSQWESGVALAFGCRGASLGSPGLKRRGTARSSPGVGLCVGDVAASSLWSGFGGFGSRGEGGDDPGDCGSGGGGARRQRGGRTRSKRGLTAVSALGSSFRGRRGLGGREPEASGQVLPARLEVSEYVAVQSGKPLLRQTSALANQWLQSSRRWDLGEARVVLPASNKHLEISPLRPPKCVPLRRSVSVSP